MNFKVHHVAAENQEKRTADRNKTMRMLDLATSQVNKGHRYGSNSITN
jgi:hypothetical protein